MGVITLSDRHGEKYEVHRCEVYTMSGGGLRQAVTVCIGDRTGHFWVDNDEYSNQVNFCPFCGAKAPKPAELRKQEEGELD